MSGVLGLTRPANGQRDLTGTSAYRMNAARERLIKAGRPVGLMTLAELEEEATRWEQHLAADRQNAAVLAGACGGDGVDRRLCAM